MTVGTGFVTSAAAAAAIDWDFIIFEQICPTAGAIISICMYAAPVKDLQEALSSSKGTLGDLNHFPWVVMSGNCFGWLVYAFATHDLFILSANIPGILVSFYLNIGASKLQYNEQQKLLKQRQQQHLADHRPQLDDNDVDNNNSTSSGTHLKTEQQVMTPQEQMFFIIMTVWAVIVVCVGWFDVTHGHAAQTFGICANLNVLFFYASPLQAMKRIVGSKTSKEIHIPTMIVGWTNAVFWMVYGFARRDIVIWGPNSIAMLLSSAQGLLCCLYPRNSTTVITADLDQNDGQVDPTPLLHPDDTDSNSNNSTTRQEIAETTVV